MKKVVAMIMIAVSLALAFGIFCEAKLGSAAEVLSSDVALIKTGLTGKSIRFTDSDFKRALGIAEFGKLTVNTLPKSTEGTLMLKDRRVYEGQTIARRSVASLYFVPASESVTESCFTFSVDVGSGEAFGCTLKFISRVNMSPSVKGDTEDTLYVTTQKDISVFGKLEATDPEDDDIDYILVEYPKGRLEVSENGEFRYTPPKGFTGKDKFVFVARDEYGNYSKPAEVTVKTTERMSEVVFVDMLQSKSYNAAVSMSAVGIMSGSRLGDDMYFNPEGKVTRAEFVAMAMKALSVKADSTLTKTFFDDNSSIPRSLVGYVATAARCGIINGSLEDGELLFRPNDPVTKCEAAIIMSNLLEIKSTSAVFSDIEGIYDVPVWARPKVGAMYEIGVFKADDGIGENEALDRESVAEYLYRLMLRENK